MSFAGGGRSGNTGGMPSASQPAHGDDETLREAGGTPPGVNASLPGRPTAWRLCALAALLAVLPLLAGCDALGKVGAGTHNPPAQAFTVSARVTALVIDGGSGSVDVTGSSRSTVSVSQQATYSSKPPSATHVLHGTTLTVSYSCPVQVACGVSYEMQVPSGVAVSVTTSAGAVTLTSLAGAVNARAAAGLITAVDLRSPVTTFKSDAGGVIATYSVPPTSLTATTNVGPITLTVPGSVAYRLSTHTVVGTSSVTVHQSASSAHSISASSDLGSISVNPS
jgi:hypothetical protein